MGDHAYQEARQAILATMGQFLRERYPGTVWLPVEGRPHDRGDATSGKVVRALAAPEEPRRT